MYNFNYFAPTQVFFGEDKEKEVGKILRQYQAHRVLIIYGGHSAKKSGLLDRIEQALQAENMEYHMLGGIVANPLLSKVYEGIELGKQNNIDFILAVGGGSVIDTAKAIGYGMYNPGDVWDYYRRKKTVTGCLPIGCVLTIAAAGSEMSNSSVITKDEGKLKRGLSSDYAYCKFAILDPKLTYTLPAYQTMSGCVDIMMHTFERYFNQDETLDIFDQIGESVIRTVIENAPVLLKDPTNEKARAEIMWAATVSHNGMSGYGPKGDWASHQLEHELSGMFDVAHGAGLAAVWPSWANYVYMENPERFAKLGHRVFGFDDSDPLACAKDTIDTIENFFKSIDMPVNMMQLIHRKCTQQEIYELTYKCSFEHTRTIGKFKVLDETDMKNIYTMVNEGNES